ncbi:related to Alpha-N-acetylgalactosaminidase precursor [Melanopsichium pennsylvanicum]|uniref:Alpha-galactosidase n=2 Tax=Melanopsichium pennsylvanicum TaxID=63383 RepID=A0AAJ4XRH2_9BASI|nr:related to Alpha-N-acetylgalactosaminidase precursor [Melanopsichium pennsylvanicum 4]SNX87139.1 related to Alpha-N-acetylgalactosaminidase precursor [Melanopsichium pennsylvanicum]
MLATSSDLTTVAAAAILASASIGNAADLRPYFTARQATIDALPTPGMGFNTYNQVSCSPTEATSHQTMDIMQSQGYLAAGYNFFQVDCGWVAKNNTRDSAGNLIVDTGAFPSGMKGLGAYAASKGLEFGLYSDGGFLACDPEVPSKRLGSLGHEDTDAAQLKSFNVSYLKYDNCYADGTTAADNAIKDARTDFPTRFGAMSKALANNGINKMLVCQWGVPQQSSDGLIGPAQWTQGLSTSFRLSDDIAEGWANVVRILNQAIPISLNGRSGPGHFADGDLLEVGNNGMTIDEQATHFAFWSMIKSPLVISTDLSNISSDAKAILLNRGLIGINQDKLGEPVKLIERRTNDYDLHAGALANGDMAVLAIDWTNTQRTIKIDFAELGVQSAEVIDLWANTSQQGVKGSFSKQVSGHGSIALRLTNIERTSTTAPTLTYIEADSGVLGGEATKAACSGCSDGKKVGNVGNGGTLTLDGIMASNSEAVLYVDYINADVGFSFSTATNSRTAQISVNGGTSQTVNFPLTGYNWSKDVIKGHKVRLAGFEAGQNNSITISNPSAYAPDFDRIGYIA